MAQTILLEAVNVATAELRLAMPSTTVGVETVIAPRVYVALTLTDGRNTAFSRPLADLVGEGYLTQDEADSFLGLAAKLRCAIACAENVCTAHDHS